MKHTQGSIEVICGSMFSGKTDELIRRLVRATIAKQKVQVFKPAIDVRYAVEKVTSHAGTNYDAVPVERAAEIRTRLEKDTTVVGIDEAQFFDAEVVEVARATGATRHSRAGGGAGHGLPRGAVRLDARADGAGRARGEAACHLHGLRGEASRTQRLVNGKPARYDDPVVIVGASEMYEARCRVHHEVPR